MNEKKQRKKRKLGSYPFINVIFSITLALLVLGLFGWLVLVGSRLGYRIRENVEIQVFLNKNMSPSDINKIRSTIASKGFTLVKDKPLITLITKEKAAEKFIEDTGEDFKNFLGDNPLRDLLAIKINPVYHSIDSLNKIKKEIEPLRGVFEVTFEEDLVESINQNITKIAIVLAGIFLFSLLVVVILINNTIKLALFSQRFLIRSMQLVGATSTFIQRPFLFRSISYGLVAGVLASIILYAFTMYINSMVKISELLDIKMLLSLLSLILLMGAVVGYFSSLRAVKKYLKMSLDELY